MAEILCHGSFSAELIKTKTGGSESHVKNVGPGAAKPPSSFCYFISAPRLLEEIQEKLEVAEILCHGSFSAELIKTKTGGSESHVKNVGPGAAKPPVLKPIPSTELRL